MTTKTWSGGATGNWNVSGNWTPSGVPATGDDVVINTSGCDVTLDVHIGGGQTNTGLGSLTITLGTLDTNDGSNRMLTVTGRTDIGPASGGADQATLTCNGSDISLGSGRTSSFALVVNQGGTFNGGSGNHTIGSIEVKNNSNAKMDFTSANTTVDSEKTGDNRNIVTNVNSTVTHSNGTIIMTFAGNTEISWESTTSGNEGPYNFTVNNASAIQRSRRSPFRVLGDLRLIAGEYNTLSGDSGADLDLTVTGNVIITGGGLVCNSSTVSVNSFTISAGGVLSAPDASGSLTINGTLSAWSFQNNSTGFSHNNGTITQTNAGHIKSVSSNPMYNFILNSSSSDSHEAVFRPSSGTDCVIAANDVTITRGVVKLNTVSNNASMGSLTIGSTGTFQASSGTTTITNRLSGQFSLSNAGTFNNNDGTVLFNGTLDQHVSFTGSGNMHHCTVNKSDNDLVQRSNLTIEGDLDITTASGHDFRSNNGTHTLDVSGDVTLLAGRFGGNTTYTANHSYGSLTIASGAEWRATSGTTTITDETTGGYGLINSGTYTHNKGKLKIDFNTPNKNAHTIIQVNDLYDLEIDMNSSFYEVKFDDTSGNATNILNNLDITQGVFESKDNGDTLTIHGLTRITSNGTFMPDANHDTNKIIHNGLVTNSGTYKINDGTTVKMNGGIRNLGTITVA